MFRKHTNIKNVTTTASLTAAAALGLAGGMFTPQQASAVPINGTYVDDIRGDVVANTGLTHELGDAAIFPPNESVIYSSTPTFTYVSVPNDGNPNDWNVRILNTSGIAWQDMFFVCDFGATVGNADGLMFDSSNAAFPPTDAFRIDSLVTGGPVNANLISESIFADDIFAPGEIWDFLVTNFTVGTSFPQPVFVTPGVFSGSSNVFNGTPGNASILANPVPEPSSLALLGIGTAAMLRRRRRAH